MDQETPMSELALLDPLPYPVYFVCRNLERWGDLMQGQMPPAADVLCDRFQTAADNWSVQTYIHLKRRGLAVTLVPRCVPGQICIVPYDELRPRDLAFRSYVVACRHDRGRPMLCEQQIVQNPLNLSQETDHFLPHWPQPALRPRDRTRDTQIEHLVYKGLVGYLAEPFKQVDFQAQLHALGIQLHTSPAEATARWQDWIDYTQADVVLAVRNCTPYDLSVKPASKLINAWFAGCPALLGPEPAYQALRQSDLDYIEVRSPADVLAALQTLQQQPERYRAMVENGFQRSRAFTADCIARQWRDLLAGAIAQGYQRWRSQSLPQQWLGRPFQFLHRMAQHRREHQYFLTHVQHGPRLFASG